MREQGAEQLCDPGAVRLGKSGLLESIQTEVIQNVGGALA